MILTDSIKEKINDLFQANQHAGVKSVGLGYKFINGERTDEIGIVFGVFQKKLKSDLPKDQILPSSAIVEGRLIKTDVIEVGEFKMASYCYSQNDPNVIQLQNPAPGGGDFPMRGGIRIYEFPTGWTINPVNASIGTLGFFATDNENGRIVGVTNSHVSVYKREIANEAPQEANNTAEPVKWIVNNQYYIPTATVAPGNNFCCNRINRYIPILAKPAINYVDGCLLIPNPDYIDNNSYRMIQPIDQPTYPASMPFATTAEINNLLLTNGANLGRVYSTGQTTGPKGWGSGGCRIFVSQVGVIADTGELFYDQIFFQTSNNTSPIAGGDSGSCVTADINGTIKIIGVMFASNAGIDPTPAPNSIGAANRIDRFASELNISAFTTPINTSLPTASLKTMNLASYGSSKTIQSGGKTYYQVGLTNNTYP
jgi:hypothetical protein